MQGKRQVLSHIKSAVHNNFFFKKPPSMESHHWSFLLSIVCTNSVTLLEGSRLHWVTHVEADNIIRQHFLNLGIFK